MNSLAFPQNSMLKARGSPWNLRGLYAITPDCTNTSSLIKQVGDALQGGATLLQYRNKIASLTLAQEQAQALLPLCQKANVPLIINDHINLALEIEADGVHIGKDTDSHYARQMLGPNKILGVSCYDQLEAAQRAEQAGANYVAFGSFFNSTTKPHALPVSIDLLYRAKQYLSIPIVAIGGITLKNAKQLVNQGADMIAIINDLFDAPNIKTQARKLSTLFNMKVAPSDYHFTPSPSGRGRGEGNGHGAT